MPRSSQCFCCCLTHIYNLWRPRKEQNNKIILVINTSWWHCLHHIVAIGFTLWCWAPIKYPNYCWPLLCNVWGISFVDRIVHVIEGVFPKDAWPELLFHDRFEVAHTIHDPINRHDDTNIRIFAQYPYEEDHRKAPDFDKDTDYWLYITSNDIVYEIPKAGRWHPNRTVSTLNFLGYFLMHNFLTWLFNSYISISIRPSQYFKDNIWVYCYANNQVSKG